MFSDVYDNELALVRGAFVRVERDPWTDSATECLMRPLGISTSWVEPRFVLPDDDAFEDELCTIFSSAVQMSHQYPLQRSALLLTQCSNQVWTVLYAQVSDMCEYAPPATQLVPQSVSSSDGTVNAVYRLHAMPTPRLNVAEVVMRVAQACVAATPLSVMTEFYVQTMCGRMNDVMIGTTLYQMGALVQHQDPIATGKYCVLKPHHACNGTGVNALLPVLSPTGTLLCMRRIVKSPAFTSLCVYMTPDAQQDDHTLKAEANMELNQLIDSICASAKTLLVPRATPAHRVLYPAHGANTLYQELMQELHLLVGARDVGAHAQNVMESESVNSLVKAVVSQRAATILQRRTTQAKLSAALSLPSEALRELEGVCFDVLMEQGCESSLPLEWQQDKFYTAGDAGFVSMLYLLQWHSTVARFMQLARAAQLSTLLLPAAYRTGIVWVGEQVEGQHGGQGSCHFVDADNTHLFLFNPARACMTLCPDGVLDTVEWRVDGSLQTQSARARDTVVSFFIAHAVHLIAPLLMPHDPMQAALVLHGMYAGAIQDDDLRHNYKQWQRVVRELRQQVPVKKRRSP